MSLSWRPLELKDRDDVDGKMQKATCSCSEMTFTNMYVWRHGWHIRIAQQCDVLLLKGRDACGDFYFVPVSGDVQDVLEGIERCMEDAAEGGVCFRMRSIPSRVHKLLCAHFNGALHTYHDRDNDDYVYLTQDLIELAGRKYHSKRNHINKFESIYSSAYVPLDDGTLEAYRGCARRWFEKRRELAPCDALSDEEQALDEALVHYKALGITGGGIEIGGNIEALALGQMLDEDTAVIHFEKANVDIPGLYTVINQRIAANAFAHTCFINREEDMGLEGLRKAKKSYHPHHMIEKFGAHAPVRR